MRSPYASIRSSTARTSSTGESSLRWIRLAADVTESSAISPPARCGLTLVARGPPDAGTGLPGWKTRAGSSPWRVSSSRVARASSIASYAFCQALESSSPPGRRLRAAISRNSSGRRDIRHPARRMRNLFFRSLRDYRELKDEGIGCGPDVERSKVEEKGLGILLNSRQDQESLAAQVGRNHDIPGKDPSLGRLEQPRFFSKGLMQIHRIPCGHRSIILILEDR